MKKLISFIFAFTIIATNSYSDITFGRQKFNRLEWKSRWIWQNPLKPRPVLR